MSKFTKNLFKTAVFIGSAIGTMYYFNKYINSSSIKKNKLEMKEDSFYEWKYGNIYYQKSGEGEPLLLIHDFSEYGSSYEWSKIVDKLSTNYKVYTIDLLGCGRSDKPQLTYTNFLYVQMITDFIKNVIKEKTTIITSGLSSSFATMSYTYDRSLINKLIFINPVDTNILNRIPSKYSRIAKDILEIPVLGTFIYNVMHIKGNINLLLTKEYMYNSLFINSDMIDTYYEAAHRGNSNGKYILSSYVGNYMGANISHGLKSIDKDILIIGGEQINNIETIIEQYKDINDNIESIIIPKAKKLPHFETPDIVFQEIFSNI